jgi:hypothetical protein
VISLYQRPNKSKFEINYFNTKSRQANTIGIVIHAARWDMRAIPDATFVSLPYAAGITMVLRPSGIASEQSAQMRKGLDIGTKYAITRKMAG